MIPLATRLDDVRFDALVEIARARLPALAPEWTDYNYHDPGIMLLELLAWVADSQIYALARNRQDERLSMARLLGVSPRGTRPATGVLYPVESPAAMQVIRSGTRLTPINASAPRLETEDDLNLIPIDLTGIRTTGTANPIDHTEANRREGVSFSAFGEPPAPNAELRLEFRALKGAALPTDPTIVALGFQIERGSSRAQPAANELGHIDVVHLESGRTLAYRLDTTRALQRSGVMLLELPGLNPEQPLTLMLRPQAPHALMPRLLRIAPNALPISQRATFLSQRSTATGRPGQTVQIRPDELFGNDEAAAGRVWRLADAPEALVVQVTEGLSRSTWTKGELGDAEPGQARYELDERADGSCIELRFGNGVNGRAPPLGETIDVARLQLSCGAAGNVRTPVDWLLDGYRTRWTNREPLAGGQDAQDADSTLAGVREVLRSHRILATSEQIRSFVEALPDAFEVARVEVEEGWERGRRRPAVPATRTVIVARESAGAETAAWRDSIARRLRPWVAIGERLLVESPVYRRFRVKAEVAIGPGQRAQDVVAAVRRNLDERFGVVKSARAPWPMGRDVDPTALGGWIRRVDGVARVISVGVLDASGRAVDPLKVGRGELPLLDGPADIAVASGSVRP